jgi:hypothetical protein
LEAEKRYARPAGGKPGTLTNLPACRHRRSECQALGRFDRLQTQVEIQARVRSYEVGGTSPAVWNTSTMTAGTDPVVEAELQRLKQCTAEPTTQEREAAA